MPTPSCDLCFSENMCPLFEKDGYHYQKCRHCGLIRIYPQPTDEALDAIYNGGYFQAWGNGEDSYKEMKRKTFARLLDMLPEKLQGTKLLDVGAATGVLMEVAQERGFDVYGIEAAKEGAASIMIKFGNDHVAEGYFDMVAQQRPEWMQGFSVVSLCDLLEHTRNPGTTLDAAHSMLMDNGYLLLKVPDADSLLCRLMGKHFSHFIVEHLYTFGRRNIGQLLDTHGFTLLHAESMPVFLHASYARKIFKNKHSSVLANIMAYLLGLVPGVWSFTSLPFHIGQMGIMAQKKENTRYCA